MFRPLLALLALALAAPAMAAEDETASGPEGPPPGQLLERVVAIVNDGVVLQSEYEELLAQAIARLRQNNTQLPPGDALQRQVLDRLIMDEIQWQRTQRIGIEVSDEQLNSELDRVAQAYGLTLAQLPEVLAREGVNYAAYREVTRKDMARQLLRRREVLNAVNITPRELDQAVERLKRMPDEQSEYNYSHILIELPFDATREQQDETARRADEVYQRAQSEDFAQLAATFSNSESALEGGNMGWVQGARLPTQLATTIATLKPGEVSRPISDPYGFHIVKLNEVRTSLGDPLELQIHARHILLTPNALQDDATVRTRLEGIRARVLAGEDFAAFATSLSEDQGSAVNGGDLDWLGPGATVPEFEAAMMQLKDGEISEPFRTQFGWHIVQVLGRREFDVTEDMHRQRAYEQLRDSKAELQLQLWLRQLRDESFVETLLD